MPLPWIEFGLDSWLLLALAGGAVAMDGSAWPQSMVCRPLVAGALGGAVTGAAADGLLVGVVLEILWLPHQPFGGARRPEAGPASLLAGAAFAGAGAGTPAGFLAAVLAGWALGWLSAGTLGWQWQWNARLTGSGSPALTDPDRLESRHRWGPRLAMIRGVVVTATLVVPTLALVGAASRGLAAVGGWPGSLPPSAAWGVAAGLGLAAGSGARTLASERWGWLAAVVGAGAAAAALLGVGIQ